MQSEVINKYKPDLTKLKLPKFKPATIILNNKVIDDSQSKVENLGTISSGDSFQLTLTSYVHSVSNDEEVPLNSSNDLYTYKKFHAIEQLNSTPSGLNISLLPDSISLSGTVTDISKSLYEFIVRVTLEVYEKNTTNLIRVDVYERYFSFYTNITERTFQWDKNWLYAQIQNEVDNQTVFYLGSWPKGQNINIPTSMYNPLGLDLKYSVEPTSFTDTLKSQDSILPKGVKINKKDGTIGGTISLSNSAGNYYFKVKSEYKKNSGTIPTNSIIFLIVVQDYIDTSSTSNNSIVWLTQQGSLGTSYSNYPSNFSVQAKNPLGNEVIYSMATSSLPLPGNMSLDQNTGMITGLCPFVNTTDTFTITVRATCGDNFSDRKFTFKILPLNTLDSFLTVSIPITEQIRLLATSWAWNTVAIPDDKVYRPDDGNYGRTLNPSILLANGLISNVSTVGWWYDNPDIANGEVRNGTLTLTPPDNEYNKYWRSCFQDKLRGYHRPYDLRIGSLDWKPCFDPDGNYLYDVVYFNINDPNADQLAWNNGIEIAYYNQKHGLSSSTFKSENLDMEHSYFQVPNGVSREYPVCLKNCRYDLIMTSNRVESPTYYQAPNATPGIGINGSESLPLWMLTSPSKDQSQKPLGWIPAIVLAYVQPNYGNIAVINLRQLGAENDLYGKEFEVDRYIVSSTSEKWILWDTQLSEQTTFDDQSVEIQAQTLFDTRIETLDEIVLFPRLED